MLRGDVRRHQAAGDGASARDTSLGLAGREEDGPAADAGRRGVAGHRPTRRASGRGAAQRRQLLRLRLGPDVLVPQGRGFVAAPGAVHSSALPSGRADGLQPAGPAALGVAAAQWRLFSFQKRLPLAISRRRFSLFSAGHGPPFGMSHRRFSLLLPFFLFCGNNTASDFPSADVFGPRRQKRGLAGRRAGDPAAPRRPKRLLPAWPEPRPGGGGRAHLRGRRCGLFRSCSWDLGVFPCSGGIFLVSSFFFFFRLGLERTPKGNGSRHGWRGRKNAFCLTRAGA